MMDDIVKPRGSPRPRRQNAAIKTLREDAPATQNGAAMEAARHDHEPNRPTRHGQVGYAPEIPTVDTLRTRPARRQALALLVWRTVISVVAPSQTALSTTKPRGTSADGRSVCCMMLIPCETTPSRSPNFIKSKSEPKLHADLHRFSWNYNRSATLPWGRIRAAMPRLFTGQQRRSCFEIARIRRVERGCCATVAIGGRSEPERETMLTTHCCPWQHWPGQRSGGTGK